MDYSLDLLESHSLLGQEGENSTERGLCGASHLNLWMLTRDFPPPAERNLGVLPPPGFVFTFPVLSRKTGRSRIQRRAGSSPGCYKCQPWASPFGSGSVQPRGGWEVSPARRWCSGAWPLAVFSLELSKEGNQGRRSRQLPPSSSAAHLQTDSKQPSLEAEATEPGREEPRPPSSLRPEHEQPGPPPLSPSRLLREESPGSHPSAPRSGFGRLQALCSPCHERERGARKAGVARHSPRAEEAARLPRPPTRCCGIELGRGSAAEHGLKSSFGGRPAFPRLSWAAGARGSPEREAVAAGPGSGVSAAGIVIAEMCATGQQARKALGAEN